MSNANPATVIGPVGIVVADARTEDDEGAVLATGRPAACRSRRPRRNPLQRPPAPAPSGIARQRRLRALVPGRRRRRRTTADPPNDPAASENSSVGPRAWTSEPTFPPRIASTTASSRLGSTSLTLYASPTVTVPSRSAECNLAGLDVPSGPGPAPPTCDSRPAHRRA